MELEQLQEQVSRLKSEIESLKILFNKGNFSSTQYFTQNILLDKTAKINGISFLVSSGAPTLSAPKGSLYLRTDGSSTSTRAYVNTDAGTTWTSITTAA